MTRTRIILGVVALAVIGIGLAFAQPLMMLGTLLFLHAPRTPFDAAAAPPAPDYSRKSAWAEDGEGAPNMAGPVGQKLAPPESRAVDVFFIHPTTFFSSEHWNQDIGDAGTNKATDERSIRNQASAFNLCCRVWAPRYRQMTLAGYLHWSGNSEQAMDLAYSDVKRAFDYYLAHENHGRPFIIASHSQGSRHARKLLAEEIDGKPIANRMVAAYVAGTWIDADWFAARKTIKPCASATDTGCVLVWATLAEGADARKLRSVREGQPPAPASHRFVCTNPLSWTQGPAPASMNNGAWIYGSGDRTIEPHLTGARCDNGALFITEPGGFIWHMAVIPGGNYHNYDYQLFYTNIRDNARARAAAFLKANHG